MPGKSKQQWKARKLQDLKILKGTLKMMIQRVSLANLTALAKEFYIDQEYSDLKCAQWVVDRIY